MIDECLRAMVDQEPPGPSLQLTDKIVKGICIIRMQPASEHMSTHPLDGEGDGRSRAMWSLARTESQESQRLLILFERIT